jgi:integrase
MIKVGLWSRNGIYYLRWRLSGKQFKVSLGHGDLQLAEDQRKAKMAELANLPDVFQSRILKLSELCKKYLQATRRLEPATVSLTERVFGHLIGLLGDIDIGQFGFAEAEKFQTWITKDHAKTTANIWCKTASPVFSWAVSTEVLDKNPFSKLELFRPKVNRIRVYSQSEFASMMDACNSRLWQARLILAKTAAMRRGEILNLTIDDVDMEKGLILVQPKEDGRNTWKWDPKDKDRRELPLVPKAKAMLEEIIAELPAKQPYIMIPADLYVRRMESKRRGILKDRLRVTPDENWKEPFLRIKKRAGIKRGTFHDLRRTCITEWLESGLKPHEVMKLAGHADIETTMEYYVAIRKELTDKARQASESCLAA